MEDNLEHFDHKGGIKHKIQNNFFDYNKIKEDNVVIIRDSLKIIYDIHFIITVRDRIEFAKPMFKSFDHARNMVPLLNIAYTVVEHSVNPTHSHFCKKNKINYMWIKAEQNDIFNKCLSYNMGVIFGPKSDLILFHDLDIVIQSDFFLKLEKNIKANNATAIQCFTKRRVLYCDEEITNRLKKEEINVDNLSLDMPGISLPKMGGKVMLGAPGGSILTERNLFFEVGGYDPELWLGYSPEDQFFWDKLSLKTVVYSCDNPDIEIFHMYHPPSYLINPELTRYQEILQSRWKHHLKKEEKLEIVELKKTLLKNYK